MRCASSHSSAAGVRGWMCSGANSARVDLLRDAAGAPCVIELELIEPSLFLDFAPGAARRLAAALLGA